MGLQSKLAKQFVSSANWSEAEYDREWDSWLRDVSSLLIAAGRAGPDTSEWFSASEWKILNVIQETAENARKSNNMPGFRDALARHRAAAEHFLKSSNQVLSSTSPERKS